MSGIIDTVGTRSGIVGSGVLPVGVTGGTGLTPSNREIFYPLWNATDNTADSWYSFQSTSNAANSNKMMCSGVAPAGFSSISAMYFWWASSDSESFTFTWSWSIAAGGQAGSTHAMAQTTMTSADSVAYTSNILTKSDLMNETGSSDLEDLIAANDIFGIRIHSTHGTYPCLGIGVTITWSF